MCFFYKRLNIIYFFCLLFILFSFLMRTILLINSYDLINFSIWNIFKIYAYGFFIDFVTSSYFSIPLIILNIFIPDKLYQCKLYKFILYLFFFIGLYILLFIHIAEYFFWEEFGARFNFIAVDYLIYTQEVIGNILESYNLPLILASLFVFTLSIFFMLLKIMDFKKYFNIQSKFTQRLKHGLLLSLIPLFFAFTIEDIIGDNISENSYNNELAKNGIHSFFAAFKNNYIKYDQFYLTKNNDANFKTLKENLATANTEFLSQETYNITRIVRGNGEEKKYSVLIFVIESLSAEYLGVFGHTGGWTKNIDRIANEGILFTNLYATGTRTERGLEAISLSVPPGPGRSIVKKPNNENMFSAGFIFKERGYDTKFIYAGYGYFDNMNYFFENNGFKTIDRTDFHSDEITFANIWGVCDEDLFLRTLKECDSSHKENKAFFSIVLTTSNHRPFTYPEGKIDIPSHTGRIGGVKYTDYSINKFLQMAQGKPWFKDTIFAIVADHCAGSAGKAKLPVQRYKIPLILYNPYLFKAQKIDKLSSQIDTLPTILSLLNWTYKSKFFGKNIFDIQPKEERAFISNYQKLGLLKNSQLSILSIPKEIDLYSYTPKYEMSPIPFNENLMLETISYYQCIDYLYRNGLYKYEH